MKNFLDKIFKKEPQFNYIIAEYQPSRFGLPKDEFSVSEYDIDAPATNDEMDIDRLYQRA
jgi:hypothetical protein